jgi:hypothetical protein
MPVLTSLQSVEHRMKNMLLGLLALTFASPQDVPAQGNAAQQVRLATAGFIDGQLEHLDGYKDRNPRLLVPSVLPVSVSGTAVEVARDAGTRAADETSALAARLRARVAAAGDTINIVKGQPGGTMGVQIRLGDPKIVGDSAVIVFALQSRGTTGRMLPGFVNRYVVVLKRRGTEWTVQSFGKANQDKVPAVLTAVPPSRR